jgi:hypothetical protein
LLEKKEHIDDLFANSLGNYEEKVPNYVWHNIQSDLKKARFRKNASIIRAMAATIALLMAFGLGYFSSDLSQYKKYEANNIESANNALADQNQEIISTEKNTTQSIVNQRNKEQELIKNESSVAETSDTKGYLFKLLKNKDNLFSVKKNQDNSNNSALIVKRNSQEKSTNQLLIDTLLFKKENLDERGFPYTKKKENKSRWSLSTKFSPVYSLAENINQPVSEKNNQLKSVRNNESPNTKVDEKALMSFSGGLNVNYRFTKRWSLESGVFYSQYRQMAENIVSSAEFGLGDELTVYTPEGIRYVKPVGIAQPGEKQIIGSTMDETFYNLNLDYVSNFEYIELPINVRFKIIDRKIGLDVLSGISTNFLVGNKSAITYNDNDLWSEADEEISPMLYNATFGLGLNYDFYQNFSFNIEPTFKYSIFSPESTMLRYPYKFAVFAGFSYRF